MKLEYSSYTDKQVGDAIISNDNKAIDYFFNKKCSKLISYIIYNVFNGHVKKNELVNELFLYLASNNWYKFRQFDYRSQLMTWISVVAIRFFIKNRDKLIENGSLEALPSKQPQEAGILLNSTELRLDINSALSKMSNKRYKKVIVALDLKDIEPEDLAKQMNITVDNIYNIHRRALKQLRLILGRKEDYYG